MNAAIHILIVLLTLTGVALIVTTRNIIHAAYALALVLMSVAGIYVLLHAELLAVVQILLYAGGVVILLVFGVMLTNRLRGVEVVSTTRNKVIGGFISIALFAGLIFLFSGLEVKRERVLVSDQVGDIAISFLTDHIIAFELIAFILLVALVGASYLAKKSADE